MKEQDLTLVGLTEDKQTLVLVSDSGEEFTLPRDARLRAALRGEHARLGQLEITMDSALRPRDIQARIRAGESPEDVAAAAQTTRRKIMAYATPVLAERAHIADRAQRASVRRKAGDGPGPACWATRSPSGSARRNVDPGTRRVGRLAPRGRPLDAGRRLPLRRAQPAPPSSCTTPPAATSSPRTTRRAGCVGEQPAGKGTAAAHRRRAGRAGCSAVGDDDELPLGEDAIELVADDPAAPADADARGPAARTAPPTARRRRRGTGDADWIATQASERPAPAEPARAGPSADAADAAEPASPDGRRARPSRREDEPATPRRPRRRRAGPRCRAGTRSCSAAASASDRRDRGPTARPRTGLPASNRDRPCRLLRDRRDRLHRPAPGPGAARQPRGRDLRPGPRGLPGPARGADPLLGHRPGRPR